MHWGQAAISKQHVARSLLGVTGAWWDTGARCDWCLEQPTSWLQALDKRDKDLRDKLGSVKDNSTELNSLQEQAEKVTALWLPLSALAAQQLVLAHHQGSARADAYQPGVHCVVLPLVMLKGKAAATPLAFGWGSAHCCYFVLSACEAA